MKPIKTQFRYIYFSKAEKYVGFAWEYDNGIMVSTRPQNTYTQARRALISAIADLNDESGVKGMIQLCYFDGEFVCIGNGDLLTPKSFEDMLDEQVFLGEVLTAR